MIRKIYKELFVILALFFLGWLGFIYIDWKPDSTDELISQETEAELGDLLVEDYLEDATLLDDDTLNQAIYMIKKRLMDGLGNTEYDYHFYVIKSDRINAFATLGGHVMIYSGLIELTDSPEELAAVLAHEIGHVEKRHVVDKLIKELGVGLLFTVLSGGDPVLVSEIVRHMVSTVFDRNQEKEADDFAYSLLQDSAISPRYVASIFRKFKEKYGDTGENLELLMTHPNTNKRIKRALEYELPSDFRAEPLNLDWEEVKSRMSP